MIQGQATSVYLSIHIRHFVCMCMYVCMLVYNLGMGKAIASKLSV